MNWVLSGFKYFSSYYLKCQNSMQQKITKIFAYFDDLKNESIFSFCVSQLVDLYDFCPQSLRIILYNMRKLLFSNSKDSRLKLKHRQLAASIIGKLSSQYSSNLKKFVEGGIEIEMEQFQIDDYNAHTEEVDTADEPSNWTQVNFQKIIEESKPLLASDKIIKESEANLKEMEQQFFQKMSNMQVASPTNVNYFMGQFSVDHLVEEQQTHTVKPKRGIDKKLQKLNKKNEEKLSTSKCIAVFNPFNYFYEMCMGNLMNAQWEIRHLAVMLLKALLPSLPYIGFKVILDVSKLQKNEIFPILTENCRYELQRHCQDKQSQQSKINDIICKCLLVLGLDRFADYQSDKCNLMIRDVAARIIADIFDQMDQLNQIDMLSIIKILLDYRYHCTNKDGLTPFSWQLRYSYITLLVMIMQDPNQRQKIYEMFKQTFLKLLDQDESDDVILAVCDCFNQLWGQPYFEQDYAEKVNKKVWEVVQGVDDITYATITILKLLGVLIEDLKCDELHCLERIEKFFTNNLRDVRMHFYVLLGKIYGRMADRGLPELPGIVTKNIQQYLQAIFCEEDSAILNQLSNLGTKMSWFLFSKPSIKQIVKFCSNILINYSVNSQIVKSKFNQKSALNNYIFIIRSERMQDLGSFILLRIFKFAEVFSPVLAQKLGSQQIDMFLHEMIVEGANENRLWLLVLALVTQLKEMGKVHSQTLHTFLQKVMKLQYNQMLTQQCTIFSKQLINLLKSSNTEHPSSFSDYISNPSWQHLEKLYQQSHSLYESSPSSPQLTAILSAAELIIGSQKQLLKIIKICSSCYYCTCMIDKDKQPKLNIVIKAIHENVREERYKFVAWAAGKAAVQLAAFLLKSNPSVYKKFNKNMLEGVATKYELSQVRVDFRKNDLRINAEYMEALGEYIVKVVTIDSNWLICYSDSFTSHLSEPEPPNSSDAAKPNPSLQLLSGTANKLLLICSKDFLVNLLNLLQPKLLLPDDSQNRLFVNSILKRLLLDCATHFNQLSNIYLEWFYDRLKDTEKAAAILCFSVLETTLATEIAAISPVCCVFLIRVVKSITKEELREVAIKCLSNVLMGAFINTKKLQFSEKLNKKAEKGNTFVRDFKNTKNFEYELFAQSSMELRSYQLEGVKWLGFLVKYMLNGALCDDMGLGKTLQTLTVIENQYIKKTTKTKQDIGASLIIAPTTLIQHWLYEYNKYFPKGILKCKAIYDKRAHQQVLKLKDKNQLFVTSYYCVEKNTEMFEGINFNFIILDEGHLIKNTRTKKFQAIKKLKSNHRFILTGTPIQNKLLELWSIFDFLMPGYLQTQQQFKVKYQKLFNVNLMTFKEDDLMFTEQQRNTLDSLHLKVMPFILRRLKSEVLRELPEKIIQDYYCHMTEAQLELYREFHLDAKQQDLGRDNFESESNSAIALLTKMRKILNHPNLIEGNNCSWQASGKFLALKQLLDDLGFADGEISITSKIIIFSRFNNTLDLIQDLLIKKLFPQIEYLKLNGSISQQKRFSVAQKFNDVVDIRLLLVTTMVGGYGLNLTSANVVIMFDHDYNPTVDMQAIDRAHRLGQKNILNVFRLITKNTLEEKIMGIQRFKTNLANAIVNIDNASIKNIEESRLPDLLEKVVQMEKAEPKIGKKLSKSFYSTLLKEMEEEIQAEDYDKQY